MANKAVKEHCPVFLLDLYISKLPIAVKNEHFIYCQPISAVPPKDDDPWFLPIPIGKNTLGRTVREMCNEAGVEGKKTNHSLRVSGASNLFAAGVPERMIQACIGHSSIESLRKYERVSEEQNVAVSKILTCENDSYEEAMKRPSAENTAMPSSSSNMVSTVHAQQPSGVLYNNCTVNVNMAPASPYCLPPLFYRPPYYPPSYPFSNYPENDWLQDKENDCPN